jgi:predicted phosphodiesterase
MFMAAIGEIRGNLRALDAVLADIDERGIQTVVNTGNCVVGGAHPNEVVDRLRARKIPSAQGLMDRYATQFQRRQKAFLKNVPEAYDALERAYGLLRGDTLEYVADLPRMKTFTAEGIEIAYCHGSPSGQDDYLRETDDEHLFLRQRERTNTPIIICGGPYGPFARWAGGTLFVHPGAVDAPRPSYALIDTEEDPWQVTFPEIDLG